MDEKRVRLSDLLGKFSELSEKEKGRQETSGKNISSRFSDLQYFLGPSQSRIGAENKGAKEDRVLRRGAATEAYPAYNEDQNGGYPGDFENLQGLQDRQDFEPSVKESGGDPLEVYNSFKTCLESVKKNIMEKRVFEVQPASDLIMRIIGDPEMIHGIYPFTLHVSLQEDYNISHQINTMIYAIKIGVGFSFSEKKLHELALGALFHDVGMFLIPQEITNKYGKLTSSDLDIIKRHPVIGRNILSVFDKYPWLAEVAFQHHERENGKGYPRGLQGNQIHEYAKIVGIVDSYEAMTHNRPYRRALMQAFSAKELIKSKNLLFSPMVIRVFLKEISLYPLGSYVRLNNRSVGRVVGTDSGRPLRPDIKIIFDGEGNPVEGDVFIRLDENPIFFIQDSLSEDELPGSVNI
jgi:HD-GYP domain-containing protein (c-di-GMP phosphodiesterase class II)